MSEIIKASAHMSNVFLLILVFVIKIRHWGCRFLSMIIIGKAAQSAHFASDHFNFSFNICKGRPVTYQNGFISLKVG